MEVSDVFTGLRKTIRDRYMKLCPYSKKTIERLTTICCLKTWMVSGLGFIFALMINRVVEGRFTLYAAAAACYIATLLFGTIPDLELRKKEEFLHYELLTYFSAVKRKFIYYKNIPEAVGLGAEGKCEEIVRNASELEHILLTDNRRKAVRDYIENGEKNRFLKLFLVQAFETSENGDTEGVVFSENIERLRLEIINEIYTEKKKRYLFSGYLFVAVFPVFAIGLVRRTGLTLSESLQTFYSGTGVFVVILCFLASMFVVSVLKDNTGRNDSYRSYVANGKAGEKLEKAKNRIEEAVEKADYKITEKLKQKIVVSGRKMRLSTLLFQMLFITVGAFLCGTFLLFSQRSAERKILLERVENIERVAVLVRDNQKKKMEAAILDSVKSLIKNNVDSVSAEEAIELFRIHTGGAFKNHEIMCGTEIERRFFAYKNMYVHWYEMTVILFVSILFGGIPLFRLWMDCGLRKKEATEEIKRFQTIILMERGFSTLSIVSLLTDLELFAEVFRPEIKECINNYAFGPTKALTVMKQKGSEKNKLFADVGESFLAIDEVGIYEAFSDVEGNRECLEKMDSLSEIINTEKKKGLLDIVAWIPGILVVFGYFVVPFLTSSVSELMELFRLLENPGGL